MRLRLAALAAVVATSWGCASKRLMPGPQKGGYAVEVEAATEEEAKRLAIGSFFDLYLSSSSLKRYEQTLEEKVLARAESFILRRRVVPGEKGKTRIRALVAYARLGRELDQLGLIRPDGVKGRPRVLISIQETGPGAGPEEGRASDALRRQLIERGYSVIDLSDPLGAAGRKAKAATDALAEAKRLRADVLVGGAASAERVEDVRLSGYARFQAKLSLQVQNVSDLSPIASFETQATGVDLGAEAAAAKSLASAGELAGSRLESGLSALYQQRAEFSLAVLNLGGLDRTRQLLEALRGLEPVAAVSLDVASGRDVKLKLFAQRISADELTAQLLRLKEFNLNVRAVEPDFSYIELASGEIF